MTTYSEVSENLTTELTDPWVYFIAFLFIALIVSWILIWWFERRKKHKN
jgi:hypothetical protein